MVGLIYHCCRNLVVRTVVMERVAMFSRFSVSVLLLLSLWHGARGGRMLSGGLFEGELPPCEDVPHGRNGWDCTDLPRTPLEWDFKHQKDPNVDCSKGPPHATADVADARHAARTELVAPESAHSTLQWPNPLPPCNFPGAIPGWDCFDPPTHDLPPCDYKHQRVGVDCWPKSPPVAKVMPTTDSNLVVGGASITDHTLSGTHHVQGVLPPCKNVPGGIQNWDCYDPPQTPLPPCDFKHQRPGIDCSPRIPPPKSKVVTGSSAAGSTCVGLDCWLPAPQPAGS